MTDAKLTRRLAEIDGLQAEINSLRPLSKRALTELREYFRVGFTYSSNAIEGNSLTESETKVVIEEGITIGGKPLKDHYEAVGHAEAFDLLYELSRKADISEEDILALHRLFYYRIDAANAGSYRRVNVIITGTYFLPPAASQIGPLMRNFAVELPELRKTTHPVEFAALIHLRLVTIHPFIDGNGRAARLLMNLALLQAGFPIAVIPPVVRSKYLEAIRKTQGPDASPEVFVAFIADMVYESQKDYRRLINALASEGEI
jgi:Fic family protein